MNTYILTRTYVIDAKSEREAKKILRECENDLDYLDTEEWIEIKKGGKKL